ncbi:hypothetical protein Hanom_Chr11g00999381 [Helianthus anomalus]
MRKRKMHMIAKAGLESSLEGQFPLQWLQRSCEVIWSIRLSMHRLWNPRFRLLFLQTRNGNIMLLLTKCCPLVKILMLFRFLDGYFRLFHSWFPLSSTTHVC